MNKFKSRLKGLSLFANVGIAETYFQELGIDILYANELLPERARFYSHVHPYTEMIQGDITDEDTFNKIVEKSIQAGVDFVIATPPCQGMSCAGRKDPHDPRNYLIYYAIEVIKRVKPRFILLENVPMQQHTQMRECMYTSIC